MFGFAPFAEAPFSALPLGSLWIEQRPSIDTWRQVDPTNVGFLVLDSDGDKYQVSFTVLTNQGYVVFPSVLNSSGQTFVAISESWQTASIGSNSWVEV